MNECHFLFSSVCIELVLQDRSWAPHSCLDGIGNEWDRWGNWTQCQHPDLLRSFQTDLYSFFAGWLLKQIRHQWRLDHWQLRSAYFKPSDIHSCTVFTYIYKLYIILDLSIENFSQILNSFRKVKKHQTTVTIKLIFCIQKVEFEQYQELFHYKLIWKFLFTLLVNNNLISKNLKFRISFFLSFNFNSNS